MEEYEGGDIGDSGGDVSTDMGDVGSTDMGILGEGDSDLGDMDVESGDSTDLGDISDSELDFPDESDQDSANGIDEFEQENGEQEEIGDEEREEQEVGEEEKDQESDETTEEISSDDDQVPPSQGSLERDDSLVLNEQIEGGVPEEYAGHHLIGISEAQSSTAMQAASEVGYNVNNENNGVALPTDMAEAENTGLPLHNGRHLGEYTDHVAHLLQELDDDYIAAQEAGEPWSDGHLLEQVSEVENAIRYDLTQHNVSLQSMDPNKPA